MMAWVSMNTMSATSGWLWVGVTALAMIGLLFTSYRYAVGYFLAGMAYWLGIEALSWLVTVITPLDTFHSYILAVALSMIPVMMGLAVKDNLLSLQHFNAQWVTQAIKNMGKLFNREQMVSQSAPRIAGHKPFTLQEDTDFTQHFIRHTPVFKYEN